MGALDLTSLEMGCVWCPDPSAAAWFYPHQDTILPAPGEDNISSHARDFLTVISLFPAPPDTSLMQGLFSSCGQNNHEYPTPEARGMRA